MSFFILFHVMFFEQNMFFFREVVVCEVDYVLVVLFL